MTIILVLFDKSAFNISQKLKLDIQSYIDDKYSEEHYPTEAEKQMARLNTPSTKPYTPADTAKELLQHFYCAVPVIASIEDRLKEQDISFSEKLLNLIAERGLSDPEVYRDANISKQVFSKIKLKPSYHPKKNTVIALAIALHLSLPETDELLSYAGYTLAKNDKSDIIVSYFIEKGIYKVMSINDVLFDYDLPLLGSI